MGEIDGGFGGSYRFVHSNRREVTARVLLAQFGSRRLFRAFDSVRVQGGEIAVRYERDAGGFQAPFGTVCIFSESGEAFEEVRVGALARKIVIHCSEETLVRSLLRDSSEGCAIIDTKPNAWNNRPWIPSICRV